MKFTIGDQVSYIHGCSVGTVVGILEPNEHICDNSIRYRVYYNRHEASEVWYYENQLVLIKSKEHKMEDKHIKLRDLVKFPCIMSNKEDMIVLFQDEENGTVLDPGKSDVRMADDITAYDYDIEDFKPFTGKITLEN